MYFVSCFDRFSKYPTAESFEKANVLSVQKVQGKDIEYHGVPRTIMLDHPTRCLIGRKIKSFCHKSNIEMIEAPAYYDCAIGLAEILMQTLKW